MTTALVVVDMQNAFIAPSGGLAVEGADEVLDAVNRRVARATTARTQKKEDKKTKKMQK